MSSVLELLLAAALACAAPLPTDADQAFLEGREAADAGVWDRAIDCYNRSVAARPEARAYLGLAEAYRMVERPKLAWFSLRRALDAPGLAAGDRLGLLLDLASLGLDLARFDEVEALLPELDGLDAESGRSTRFRLWLGRGHAALERRDFGTAHRAFAKAHALGGGDLQLALDGSRTALKGLAAALAERGQHGRAVDVLLRCWKLEADEKLTPLIQQAFDKAGRPADKLAAVTRAGVR